MEAPLFNAGVLFLVWCFWCWSALFCSETLQLLNAWHYLLSWATSNLSLLKVWYADLKCQLGTCSKCRISGPPQTYWLRSCIFNKISQMFHMPAEVWQALCWHHHSAKFCLFNNHQITEKRTSGLKWALRAWWGQFFYSISSSLWCSLPLEYQTLLGHTPGFDFLLKPCHTWF